MVLVTLVCSDETIIKREIPFDFARKLKGPVADLHGFLVFFGNNVELGVIKFRASEVAAIAPAVNALGIVTTKLNGVEVLLNAESLAGILCGADVEVQGGCQCKNK